jgi:tetratricopeptide (TPR) repeat protein
MHIVKAKTRPLDLRSGIGLVWPIIAIGAFVAMAGCQKKVEEPLVPPATQTQLEAAAGPCSPISAGELEKRAIELLDRGDIQAARTNLNCALELRPSSYRARSLIEQLDADPQQKLGRTHFRYRVDSNDTLSKIAERFLGSSLNFVILARYNEIAVPADLKAGQLLKIPGDKPAAEEDPRTVPRQAASARSLRDQALAAETAGDLDRAYTLIDRARELDPKMPNIGEQHAQIKDALIASIEEQAYAKEVAGFADAAVELWRKVLAIDTGNIPAQLALKRLGAQ